MTFLMLGPTSLTVRSVRTSLTPQLTSYPMPPGEMIPFSESKAATPPMGNPYPQCMSGIASDFPTMPGRQATFAACSGALSAQTDLIILSSEKMIADVVMQDLNDLGISNLNSSFLFIGPVQANSYTPSFRDCQTYINLMRTSVCWLSAGPALLRARTGPCRGLR